MPEATEKKTRAKEYHVEYRKISPDGTPITVYQPVVHKHDEGTDILRFADTGEGRKWIRDHAEAGVGYRVIRVCWQGKVEVQTRTVRKLA